MAENLQPEAYVATGNNELRFLEYTCANLSFGINGLKTKRIIQFPENLKKLPECNPAVLGITDVLGITVPIIDLAKYLKVDAATLALKANTAIAAAPPIAVDQSSTATFKKVIITEFYGSMYGFLVDKINYFHTIKWEDVSEASKFGSLLGNYTIGVVFLEGQRSVLLIDYERIVLELSPQIAREEKNKGVVCQKIENLNKKVLIVDDSPTVLSMLSARFLEMGFTVLEATDGDAALALVAEHEDLDLLISDIEMPQKDGLTLTVNAKEMRKNLPVIVYSSISDMGMKERVRQAQANVHVTKLNIHELITNAFQLMGLNSQLLQAQVDAA